MENGYRSETSRSGVAGCVGYACLLGASKSLRFDALTQANHAFGGTKNCPPPPEFTACRQIVTECRTRLCSVICQVKVGLAFRSIFSRKAIFSRFGFRLNSAEGAEAHLHQAMPFREALRWRAMLRPRFNVGGDAVSGVFSTRNPSNCESLRKRGVSRVFRRPFPFVLLAAFFKLGKRWLSSLPRCGNPPSLAPRQQSGGFHVERDAVCKEVRLCRMGDGTIIRPLCCPCLRALASRQKLFWRRSGKSFVMPAFTPCL